MMSKVTGRCVELDGDLYVRVNDLILEFQRASIESKSKTEHEFFAKVSILLQKVRDSAEFKE